MTKLGARTLLAAVLLFTQTHVYAHCEQRLLDSRMEIEQMVRDLGRQLTPEQSTRLSNLLADLCDGRQPGDSVAVRGDENTRRKAISTQDLNPKSPQLPVPAPPILGVDLDHPDHY